MKAAFTGHRPESLPFGRNLNRGHFEEFQVVLWNEISRRMDEGYDTFYCGGAREIDLLCGEIVLAEKMTRHPNVKLICAIPYKEQAERWGWMWRQRYYDVLRGADSIKQICDGYHRECFHIRNRYMVDSCDLLIVVHNGQEKGGTAYTVNYAMKQGKEIVVIHPDTLERTVIPARNGMGLREQPSIDE